MMNPVTFPRHEASYENLSDDFRLKTKDFGRQFSHIYFARLMKYKPILEDSIREKWGSMYEIKQLTDLVTNEKVIIYGTIYKHQELKPNILRELSDEHQLLPIPANEKFTSSNDFLILEDKQQRIILTGDICLDDFVTGVVVGLLGFEDKAGKFHVEDSCFPLLKSHIPPKLSNKEKRFIAFISGLDIGASSDMLLPIHEVIACLVGKSGSPEMQEMMSQVSRLIIAGNSISSSTQDRGILDKAKYLMANNNTGSNEAVQIMDEMLFNLSASLPVDVMPGANDPTNYVLPQQPLHRCMFPSSERLSTLNMVTNPYRCKVGELLLAGTSGQPASDILRNSSFKDPLDALEKTLIWGHMCPTAPDTLGCYPFTDDDPFILDCYPDVYFAGNQDYFAHRIWQGPSSSKHRVCLLSIPRFSDSSSLVLLDTLSLDCFTLTVSIDKNMF